MKTLTLQSLKKQLNKLLILLSLMPLPFTIIKANNIQVNIDTMVVSGTTASVQFDLSWENSWNSTFTGNWDAAWVFFKYRSNGVWQHLDLSGAISTAPGYTFSVPADKKGIFIYQSASHSGNFSLSNIQVGVQTTGILGNFDLRVFAIEMVNVPQAAFYVGVAAPGVTPYNSLYKNNPGAGFTIGSGSTTFIRSIVGGDVQVVGSHTVNIGVTGITLNGTNGLDGDNDGVFTTGGGVDNSQFPTGYKQFYCMKYEISQGAYRDYLNTLTLSQQQQAVNFGGSGLPGVDNFAFFNTSVNSNFRNGIKEMFAPVGGAPAVFGCDANDNGNNGINYNETSDGECTAMNFLTPDLLYRYLNWAALRPMSELEYEKACRGPSTIETNTTYPWGIVNPYSGDTYIRTNILTPSESLVPTITGLGNVIWALSGCDNCGASNTPGFFTGPSRNGVFATSTSSRLNSGASYWGIMELAGNVAEITIGVNTAEGRAFRLLTGTGMGTGDAEVIVTLGGYTGPIWPDTPGSIVSKGASFGTSTPGIMISDRLTGTLVGQFLGGRGVR